MDDDDEDEGEGQGTVYVDEGSIDPFCMCCPLLPSCVFELGGGYDGGAGVDVAACCAAEQVVDDGYEPIIEFVC